MYIIYAAQMDATLFVIFAPNLILHNQFTFILNSITVFNVFIVCNLRYLFNTITRKQHRKTKILKLFLYTLDVNFSNYSSK